MDRNATSVRSGIISPQSVSHRDARMKFQIKRRKEFAALMKAIECRKHARQILRTAPMMTLFQSPQHAAHMLRIKTPKSLSCIEEENETGACFLQNKAANIWDQHKQCKEEIALMWIELQRHSQEMEMKLGQKLSEFIVQMGTLICTETREISRDEKANLQLTKLTTPAWGRATWVK